MLRFFSVGLLSWRQIQANSPMSSHATLSRRNSQTKISIWALTQPLSCSKLRSLMLKFQSIFVTRTWWLKWTESQSSYSSPTTQLRLRSIWLKLMESWRLQIKTTTLCQRSMSRSSLRGRVRVTVRLTSSRMATLTSEASLSMLRPAAPN